MKWCRCSSPYWPSKMVPFCSLWHTCLVVLGPETHRILLSALTVVLPSGPRQDTTCYSKGQEKQGSSFTTGRQLGHILCRTLSRTQLLGWGACISNKPPLSLSRYSKMQAEGVKLHISKFWKVVSRTHCSQPWTHRFTALSGRLQKPKCNFPSFSLVSSLMSWNPLTSLVTCLLK